jgi:hypothetical protein
LEAAAPVIAKQNGADANRIFDPHERIITRNARLRAPSKTFKLKHCTEWLRCLGKLGCSNLRTSPEMMIILASFPWQEEALSVATHKPNVYIDLSGWSPKYFPPILVR